MTVRPKEVALWIGALLAAAGLIISVTGTVLVVMEINPAAAIQLAMFGMLIFGVGLALLLTQVFAEKYSISIAGMTFAGTLAAVYIFLWITAQFVFKSSEEGAIPRDLELSLKCPRSTGEQVSLTKRTPLIVIPGGHKDYLTSLRKALERRGSGKMVRGDVRQVRFGHVKGEILVEPLSAHGGDMRFFLPESIRSGETIDIAVVAADDNGALAGGTGSGVETAGSDNLIRIFISRGHSDGGTARPLILAEIDFSEISKVCGA